MKMSTLHAHFIGIGPACPSYDKVGKTPGSKYTSEQDRNKLMNPDMKELLIGLSKTITGGVDEQVFSTARKNIYGLRETAVGSGILREK